MNVCDRINQYNKKLRDVNASSTSIVDLLHGIQDSGSVDWQSILDEIEQLAKNPKVVIDARRVNDRDRTRYDTALLYAVRQGYTAVVQKLVDLGADVSKGCVDGRSPLHVAARFDEYDIADILILAGADSSTYRSSPLQLAVDNQHLNVVCLFLRRAVPIDTGLCKVFARYAFHFCSRDYDILQLLIKYDRDRIRQLFLEDDAFLVGRSLRYAGESFLRVVVDLLGDINEVYVDRLARKRPLIDWFVFYCPSLERMNVLLSAGANVNLCSIESLMNVIYSQNCSRSLKSIVAAGLCTSTLSVLITDMITQQRNRYLPERRCHIFRLCVAALYSTFEQIPEPIRACTLWHPDRLFSLSRTEIDVERRRLSLLAFAHTKQRMFDMCIALQPLHLPALLTLFIINASFDKLLRMSMHLKWSLITTIKHLKPH